jgi:predicted unusual protein kinase regulating ubiquinone biosynthesis (AarF/ABC1/UbiB family)
LFETQAAAATALAMELGGLVIKLGQHVSTRVDIFPTEYTAALARLQDTVPAVPGAVIVPDIERDLGLPLTEAYRSFETEAIAAASLGQVHRAELPNGTPVAVKALRPGIEELVAADLGTFRTVLKWVDRLTTAGRMVDLAVLYTEFEETLLAELDLVQEGRNAERFQRAFLLHPGVDIPQIYWQRTTRRVLTMELMTGHKVSDTAALDAAGVDRRAVARTLLEVYLQMVLDDGFFHADPHPGNLLVRDDGVLILLDVGMVGALPDTLRAQFAELIIALFTRDTAHAVDLLAQMGFLRRDADYTVLVRALEPMIDTILGAQGKGRVALTPEDQDDLRDFIYSQPFELPTRVTFLSKALINVIGVCLQLDPELDLWEELSPLVRERAGGGVADILGSVADQLRSLVPQALPTARHLVELSGKANRGELTVRLSRRQEARLARTQGHETQRVVRSILGGVLALGGLDFLAAGAHSIPGWTMTSLGAVVLLAQLRRPGKTPRRRRNGPPVR